MPSQLDTYLNLLKRHDWWFDYSDDHSVWRAGLESWDAITRLQPIVDPDFKIFNQHKPQPAKELS